MVPSIARVTQALVVEHFRRVLHPFRYCEGGTAGPAEQLVRIRGVDELLSLGVKR